MRLRTTLPWLVLLPGTLAAQAATSLTIYRDGRVLERRRFEAAVPAGISHHRLPVSGIDLGTLFSPDSAVVVTGATHDPAVDEANALRRSIGRRLAFRVGRANGGWDTVVATVLGTQPERYRMEDGRITFQRPGLALYPPDVVLERPEVVVTVRARRARPRLDLAYFSSGASWSAAYAITLGSRAAGVVGHATLAAGPLAADSAEIQLLAGSVGRAGAQPGRRAYALEAARVAAPSAPAAEEEVGEAHLYSLPGRWSLTPGLETTALLFEPAEAPYQRTYLVDGQLPYYGPLPQLGDEVTLPVAVRYTIERRDRAGFGDVAVPGGVARLYQRDRAGRPQLIGEGTVGHTAPGQSLEIDAGSAFDLTAKRVQTSYATRRDSSRMLGFASYRVTIANAKDSAVVVDLLERRAGEWSVTASSLPGEKLSSSTTRFRVRVPARGETTLTYSVRVVW